MKNTAEIVYVDKNEEIALAIIFDHIFYYELLLPEFIINGTSLAFAKKDILKTPIYNIGRFENKEKNFNINYFWFFKWDKKKIYDFLDKFYHAIFIKSGYKDTLKDFTEVMKTTIES